MILYKICQYVLTRSTISCRIHPCVKTLYSKRVRDEIIMKRRFVKVFACMAVTAIMLSVTACGSTEAAAETAEAVEETATVETEAEVEEEVEAEAEGVEEATEEVAEEAAAATDATTLEYYYNDPAVKAAMEAKLADIAEEGMSASLEVKENTMTAIIKIEDESYIVDGIGDLLSVALDEEAATFEELPATFDEVIGESGACTVIMRYVDPQDNVLAEKAYTAK